MKKKENVIYITQQGYDEILESIEELKKQRDENNKNRKEAFDAGAGDGWDSPEFEEIERKENLINGELKRKYEELSKVVIIEKHNDVEAVNIDDVILVDMIFSEEDREELMLKLVGTNGNTHSEIQEVSINSPIGKAVYQQKIGSQCSYSVNNKIIIVLIKQKLDVTNQQENFIKKLTI